MGTEISRVGTALRYPSGKPFARWWWFACDIRKEDVTAQLEWVKENGFGGVEIAWVFPPRGDDPWARAFPGISSKEKARRQHAVRWLSPEWSAMVAHAKLEADRLGLGCDYTFGTLWPFGDTHVPPADASKEYCLKDPARTQYKFQFIKWSWEQPATGLVIDHLNRTAFANYARRIGKALRPAMAGNTSGLFCDSWEVHSERIWTEGFADIFIAKHGYDIEKYMAEIWSDVNSDVRYDYISIVSNIVIDSFYKQFVSYARKQGCFSRMQVAGAPVDLIAAYALVDVPETEAMLYEPNFARIVASAAALGGRPEVSSETFTCIYGFPDPRDKNKYRLVEQVSDLKLVADALFANGVNQIFWHGMPFTPAQAAHDFGFYATVHVGREGKLAPDLRPFNAYMETVSSILKRGRTYTDVAILLPFEDGIMAGKYAEAQLTPGAQFAWELRYVSAPEEIRGHHPLWISYAFLKTASVQGGRLLVGGLEFQALYIDVKYLSAECLQEILRLGQKGLPIIMKQEPRQPGRRKAPQYSANLISLGAIAKTTFADAVRWPALVASADGEKLLDFWARVDGDTTLLFFSNPHAQELKLPLRYGQSLSTKTLTRKVLISANGKQHALTLSFHPYQSVLLKISPQGVQLVDTTYNPPVPVTQP